MNARLHDHSGVEKTTTHGRLSLKLEIFCYLLIVLAPAFVLAQTYPQDFNYSRYNEVLIDAGLGWRQNSIFHPLRVPEEANVLNDSEVFGAFEWMQREMDGFGTIARSIKTDSKNGLAGIGIVGLEARDESGSSARYGDVAVTTNVWAQLRFHSQWYTRSSVRATSNAASLSHFSGVTRKISRFGIDASEVDQGVFGFENDWSTIEFGRTREIWGPLAEDNLAPAGGVPAWEELKLEGRYKRLTYRYFYGFLEAVQIPESGDIIQRYVMGRALEYRNGHNLVIGVTEFANMSGKNRPVDWAFLNPISIEVEVEQNHRGNSEPNSTKANAVWISHVDWLPFPSLRVAGSLLIDEFQFDKADRNKGRSDLTGYLFHLAWTPKRSPIGITAFFDWVWIGTYTMMHDSPYTVFSTRGQFMGNSIGNDAEKIEVGGRMIFGFPLMIEAGLGTRRWGDMSLLSNPYKTFQGITRQPFPSGEVRSNQYVRLRMDYQPLRQLTLGLNGHFDISHKGTDSQMNAILLEARFQMKPMSKSF